MTGGAKLPRGGKTGRSVAPRRTLYKDKGEPQLWAEFRKAWVKVREDGGLSRKDVAERMGVTLTRVANIEAGFSIPHPWDLCVYLEAIGVKQLTAE